MTNVIHNLDEKYVSPLRVNFLSAVLGIPILRLTTCLPILWLSVALIITAHATPVRASPNQFDPTDTADAPIPIILTAAEQTWLDEHPVIRVAPDPDFRPIEYFDEAGHYHGTAADMIALLGEKTGLTIEPVRLANWDEVLQAFKAHEVDMLGAIVCTPSRREYTLFTDTLISVPGGILSAGGLPDNITLADLAGKRVAVVSNYTAHDLLARDYPEIRLDVVPDVATGLAKASTGMVDAYVENMANASYYSQQAGITNLKLVGYTDFEYSWCIGVRDDWPELQGILNKGLAAITEDQRKEIMQRWIYISSSAWQPSESQIIGVLSILLAGLLFIALVWNFTLRLAIQRRIAVEGELKRTRNYIADIIDSMPSLLVGVDKLGTVTLWNARAAEKTGTPADLALGRPVVELLPEIEPELENVAASIRTRRTIRGRRQVQQPENGSRFSEITIYPLSIETKPGAVIRIDDVTERVRLEEMMVQGEKMLSIGGLAAGMAHEINNPLAGVIQNANNMQLRLGNLDMPANRRAAAEAGTDMEAITAFMERREIPKLLSMIQESGTRMALLVKNMLSFARKSESAIAPVDIAELVDRTLELACTDYDLKKKYDFKTIEVVKVYQSDLPPVPCEAAKIQQVLLNILRNGAYAMSRNNEDLSANGKPTRPPVFTIRLALDDDPRMLRLEIEDNGPGMAPGLRRRIFEPFFTTKPVGEGTGLGLSVSYFIITDNHNGSLTVDSEPGKGATFVIRLPLEH